MMDLEASLVINPARMRKMDQSVEDMIEYGLDTVSSDEKIEIDLRDFIHIYKTFEELNRFFHQPMHYQSLADVETYLGDKTQGAYSVIHKMYYHVMDKYVQGDLKERLENDENGSLINPDFPYYYHRKR